MTFRFGTFEFDSSTSELRKNGRVVALEPQPARALALLLARADQVVSRDELKEVVWGSDTHVDFDRGLAYCLSQIRAVLGDSGDNPRFVQTIPKRGYRFIAPVTSAGIPSSADPSATGSPIPERSSRAAVSRVEGPRVPGSRLLIVAAILLAVGVLGWAATRSRPAASNRIVIAVSIFDNETGEAKYDRLVTGLSDLVVTHLAGLDSSHLAVIGNAAVLRQPRNIRDLKAVAAGVKADYVVLGQLQRADTGYRFITHLVRLSDETHLKANRLQMPDGDVAGLEDAVVAEFDRAVKEHVLPRTSS
jgi:DNA-binding winged helix-turn-helix (wHTH) protein/TolB-like protein